MGNQTSGGDGEGSKYGGLFLKLDQQVLIPGQPARGTIYLNLTSPYPGDKICLEIKGTEYTKWTERERRRRYRKGKHEYYYVSVKRHADRFIIRKEIDVYDWQQGAIVPAGQYSLPFQFIVPDHLPGSFFFGSGSTVAEILYSIEAYLKPENESVPRICHKVNVTVREMPRAPIETKEISSVKLVKTCCCCEKGTVSMRTAFEKNAYAPSEEAKVLTEIDNSKCSVGISNVKFSLIQTLTLAAGVHRKRINFTITTADLGKIEAGQARTGSNRLEASIRLPPGQEGRAQDFMNDDAEEGNPDPSIITPTTTGSYVTSQFHLMLVSEMDGCSCGERYPTTELPVTIYSAALQKAPEPIAPPNWHPQQLPVANLVIVVDNGMPQYPMQQQDPNMMMSQMPQNYGQPNQMQQPNMSTYPQQPQNFQQPQYNMGYQQQGYQQQQGFQQPQYNAQTYNTTQPGYIQPQPVQVAQNQYPNQG